MKRSIVLLIAILFICSACATSLLTSRIGVEIGKGFIKSRDIGVPEARKLLKAWPYISGQVHAIPHYKERVPGEAQAVIDELDKIAEKQEDAITEYNCGEIVTRFVLFEYYAAKFGWEEYGIDAIKWIRSALGV